jgi:hypothetical protein
VPAPQRLAAKRQQIHTRLSITAVSPLASALASVTRIKRSHKTFRGLAMHEGSMKQNLKAVAKRLLAIVYAPLALGLTLVTPALAGSPTHQIVLDVREIKALDKFDEFSLGDIFARVTIAGTTQSTPILKQTAAVGQVIKPDWQIIQNVGPGVHPVKLELIDKDLSQDDVIDINKLPKRRVLEFTIDTRRCRIDGFASTYNCKSPISRAGKEAKAAGISFTVDAKPVRSEVSSR